MSAVIKADRLGKLANGETATNHAQAVGDGNCLLSEGCHLGLRAIAAEFTLLTRRWAAITSPNASKRVDRLASTPSTNWRQVRRLR